jgi:hypothetical protein
MKNQKAIWVKLGKLKNFQKKNLVLWKSFRIFVPNESQSTTKNSVF